MPKKNLGEASTCARTKIALTVVATFDFQKCVCSLFCQVWLVTCLQQPSMVPMSPQAVLLGS